MPHPQILCKDPAKKHDFTVEAGTTVTSDVSAITGDAGLDIVVEVLGGKDPALDVLRAAAAKGQHAVTANKALLAEHLPSLDAAFAGSRTTARRGCNALLGYEAAVAGGVPVIRALRDSLLPDTITRVHGVLNGTTNYILTKMAAEGTSYAAALAAAQAAGFAEADPSADVLGEDAANKLVILAKLAFGVYVHPFHVPTTGITLVKDVDFQLAHEFGYTIKLVGSATLVPPRKGEARAGALSKPRVHSKPSMLDMFVSPMLVPESSPIGATAGADNIVLVDGAASGTTSYSGAGAGRYPTANSVVADMVAIATNSMGAKPFPRPPPVPRRAGGGVKLTTNNDVSRWWYVRGPTGVVGDVTRRAWEHLVFFSSAAREAHGMGMDAVVLAELTFKQVDALVRRAEAKAAAGGVAGGASVAESTIIFPVDDEFEDEDEEGEGQGKGKGGAHTHEHK